jgi:hypothetical protein
MSDPYRSLAGYDDYRSVVDYDREEARSARWADPEYYYDDDKPSASDLAYDAQLDDEDDNR